MKNGVYTVLDLLACLDIGGRIIGIEKGKVVALNRVDVDSLKLIDSKKNSTYILVNGKREIKVELVIATKAVVNKVNHLVNYDDQYRDITIYIQANEENKFDDIAIKYILLVSALCELSKFKYSFKIKRYKNLDEIDKDQRDYKIFLSDNESHNEYFNTIFNCIPLILSSGALPTYDIVAILSSCLRINKMINLNMLTLAYEEYSFGKLKSEEFKLWSEAYNKFFNFDPEKKYVYLPEIIAKDKNTNVIVTYLISRYKQERNKIKLFKDRDRPDKLDFNHSDIDPNKIAKEAVDECYKTIVNNYLNAVTIKDDKENKIVLDYNKFLPFKLIEKRIHHGVFYLTISNDAEIEVYISNKHMMDMITESDFIKSFTDDKKIETYTLKYIEI